MRTPRTLLCVLAAVGFALAADRPNFSGSWKLDASQSDIGAPVSSKKIDQDDKELRMTTTQGGQSTETKLSFDGKENENKVSAKWEGSALVLRSRREVNGMKLQSEERWTLDGNALTVRSRVTGMPSGDLNMKFVYVKE